MITIHQSAEEIEADARSAGFSMRVVCSKAGLAYTTWYRWKNAQISPSFSSRLLLSEALAALRAEQRT